MSGGTESYGIALFDLAQAEGLDKQIMQQLDVLEESFQQEPEFLRLLSAHEISKQERCQILENSFGEKLHPYVLNTLKLLTEKGGIRHFDSCCKAYRQRYQAYHGILPVRVCTAAALTPEQADRLARKLRQLTGKTVLLEQKLQPSLLGGIRLEYGGVQLEDTLRQRLDAVGAMLKNTAL